MDAIWKLRSRVLQIAAALFPLVAFAAAVHADIFQWEYTNAADPSQGKRQSTTLAPDGAGVNAVPGADLQFRNLTMAHLTGADLSLANLGNTDFYLAALSDANFTGAEVRGADFKNTTPHGFTAPQLYSTASYQARDLTGIILGYNDLTGWSFAGQKLTNASFGAANLTGANFRQAVLANATFTAYFCGVDGTGCGAEGATLTDADFSDADVRGAGFHTANLTDANFTGANIQGASFVQDHVCGEDGCYTSGTGLALAQLYSTASYQAHDLRGISLGGNDLTGGNFAGQNLTNAIFVSRRSGSANLTGVDLSAADVRGTIGLELSDLSGATTANVILPDGHIHGVDVDAGALLVVSDYHGPWWHPTSLIPITIDEYLTMGPGGTLRMVFEEDAWDSTISFAPGIPVTLGGTLEFTFADDVNLARQVGRTFHVFNWTGVNPTGAFAISSPYAWDLSNLYTTGEVTLSAIPEPAGIVFAIMGAFGLTLHHKRKLL